MAKKSTVKKPTAKKPAAKKPAEAQPYKVEPYKVEPPIPLPCIEMTGDEEKLELLRSIDVSLKLLAACVQQQTDPETKEPTKTWLKTREFG